MAGLNAKQTTLLGGVAASVIGCVLLAWWSTLVNIDPAFETACHRAIAKSTPSDLRDIKTIRYLEDGPRLGTLRGRLEKRVNSKRWAKVTWTCRIDPANGQVLRASVMAFGGTHRLKSAAAPFIAK